MNPWKVRFDDITKPDMKAEEPEPRLAKIIVAILVGAVSPFIFVLAACLGGRP